MKLEPKYIEEAEDRIIKEAEENQVIEPRAPLIELSEEVKIGLNEVYENDINPAEEWVTIHFHSEELEYEPETELTETEFLRGIILRHEHEEDSAFEHLLDFLSFQDGS